MKKHSVFRLRKSEATNVNRILAFNKEEVQNFYSKVEATILEFKFSPNIIYNVDETGITTVQILSESRVPMT
jgi:hypothetical protein